MEGKKIQNQIKTPKREEKGGKETSSSFPVTENEEGGLFRGHNNFCFIKEYLDIYIFHFSTLICSSYNSLKIPVCV